MYPILISFPENFGVYILSLDIEIWAHLYHLRGYGSSHESCDSIVPTQSFGSVVTKRPIKINSQTIAQRATDHLLKNLV